MLANKKKKRKPKLGHTNRKRRGGRTEEAMAICSFAGYKKRGDKGRVPKPMYQNASSEKLGKQKVRIKAGERKVPFVFPKR